MSDVERGGLPTGWVSASIEELLGPDGIFCDGDWVESKDQDPSGAVRLIQLADVGDGEFRDRSARFLTDAKAAELRCTFLESGDILIARMPDPLGRACVFPGDRQRCVTVVDVCIVRPRSQVDTRWLMHQLNAPQIRRLVTQLQSGTTRKRISRKNLASIVIPVPALTEQRRIATLIDELLSDLDAGVAALERVRAKLKHYRAVVLKAAVEGALTAEWRREHPATETADALLTRILAERRRRWEEAQLEKFAAVGKAPPDAWKARYGESTTAPQGLPSIPEGWCWATLDDLLWQLRSGSSESSSRTPTDFPVLKSSAVRPGRLDLADLNFLSEVQSSRPENFLAVDDVLITRLSGSVEYVGCCAIVGELEGRRIQYPDRLFCGKLVGTLGGKYLTYAFQHPRIRRELETAAKSTAGHKRISISDLLPLAIPVPPPVEQEAIIDAVESQLSVIDHVEADIERRVEGAQSLRQSILRHAFTGQLVPQDPNDEPASELLKRIAAEREERARLAKAAKQARPATRTARARTRKP